MIRVGPPVPVDERLCDADARASSLPQAVGTAYYRLATALADAVLDEDSATARKLAADVRALTCSTKVAARR